MMNILSIVFDAWQVLISMPLMFPQSSLMQLLLGELPIQEGKAIINGSLSYAAQKPWLFSGTVRNNILFGQLYEKKRYNEVRIAFNPSQLVSFQSNKFDFDFRL